ncbi:MAG: penicillin acylase family protein [Actinobacteria bacterium]|nr:penicillin acylase family protein [Actinomycetota bacterium]
MTSEWGEMVLEQAREALPPVEGEVSLPGLAGPVEVIRDTWGVPHIYAGSLEDLFTAQGYVTASDRLWQMDFLSRISSGRLSGLVSEMALSLDRFFRTVGLNRAGRAAVAGYDDLSHTMVQSYIRGINAWIASMPAPPVEYRILDLEVEPFADGDEGAARGAAIGAFMAWILSTNWDAELLRVEIAGKLGYEAMLSLFPDVSTEPGVVIAGKRAGETGRRGALDILSTAPIQPKGQGSNNWVVAGSRTASGKPLLANDPHLVVQMPAIWYETHLSAPGYEVSGVTIPGVPGVVIGHTAHHAWGFTNVGGDCQDLYLERLNEDRTAALYDGEWEPVTVHREEIDVRGHDEPVVLEVPETRHGPIVDSYMIGSTQPTVIEGGITETYALRWVGHDRTIQPSTLVRMAQAGSFQGFREAARDWACPGQNMVYADVEGHIGYQCTGWHPIRTKGDGTIPVPGWTSEHDWTGYVPFEELPWSEDPAEGFLATANHKIHDDSYPHLISKDFLPPFRARRIVEMITATEKHSKLTFAKMQFDTTSLPARRIVPRLLEVEPADDRQKEAMAHLAEWDHSLTTSSVGACIYEVWSVHIAREVLLPRLGEELFQHFYGRRQWTNAFQYQVLPDLLDFPSATWFGADGTGARDDVLRRALSAAIDFLTAELGDDTSGWRWGALHKARFVGQLAMIPDLEDVFTAGVVEHGGDEQTVLQGQFEPGYSYDVVVVPSWRQIIDLADVDSSLGVFTVGQSGNPASPHFNDQVQLCGDGEYHRLPFTRAAVERYASGTLTLTP